MKDVSKQFAHLLGHSLVGIPQYTNKQDLQFPTFKNCLALTESEVQMMIDQAHSEYLTTLTSNMPNAHEVVMLNMYDGLMVSLKVYDKWWQSTGKDV